MTQSLKNLLNQSTEFRAILGKAQSLHALQQQLSAVTPDPLAQSAQVLSLEFGTMTIAAANSAVAAKLRQLAPEIVTKLQNGGVQVSGIRIKVQVSYPAPAIRKQPHHLSKTAQTAIQELENKLNASPLKDALKRIAGKDTA